ncbi:MAG: hypothetical protein PHP92_04860 [Candidatus Nanoarchaeia archaeon]|nr:hypothetical protein [Candidatus Nanoarchaeia archaeon]
MNINELLRDLIKEIFQLQVGYIDEVDEDAGFCYVKVSHGERYKCDVSFHHAYSDIDNQKTWGDFSVPSRGTLVLISLRGKQPTIITMLTGYKNFENVYSNDLKINRPKIPVASRLTLVDEDKMAIGEKLIRSIGIGDIFLDYFGNLVLDSSREIIIRIGDRDVNNKITTKESTLRFGRVRNDTDGEEKLDSGGKKIKLELIHNTNNKITLNESGVWKIENANASIEIRDDGVVVVNGGSLRVARKDDPTLSDATMDTDFWTKYVPAHIHSAVTPGQGVSGPPVPPTPTQLVGIISEGNENLLSD